MKSEDVTPLALSAVAILAFLLGQCFLVGCDEKSGKVELSAMNFQGEATLEYLEKPGIFGSKGVQLSFEDFSLTDGIDKTYVLKNIPALKQPYRLLFLPDARLSNDLSTNLQITTVLEDSSGRRHWNVEAPLSQWRVSETGGRTAHFYMLSTKTGLVECALTPDPKAEYKLHVRCKVLNPAILATVTNKNAHFCLRAGGYK